MLPKVRGDMEGFVLPVSQGSGSSAVSLDGKSQVNP